jgi:serine/threonine protein kinase
VSPAPPPPSMGIRATQVARITHIVREPPPDGVDEVPAHALPQLKPPLVPGDLGSFGGHRVVRLLGQGGMGAVYEAIDPGLGRTIALKLMLPAQATSEAGRQRFLREARASAAIRHENVVTIYHVGEDAGVPFLAMEFLRGQPLSQTLPGTLPAGEVARIGREVARGLAAAHAFGVVHRDIKPENIWIEETTGRVRLLDFGLARFGADFPADPPETPPPGKGAAGLTQVGAIIGTPAYMAPEQARGEPVDDKADLFSLGCVLYHMLTGSFPFRGANLREQIQALTAGAYVPIDSSIGVPHDLTDLVHRLLGPTPADRPASAAAVADELLTIGTRLMVLAGGTTPVPLSELNRDSVGAREFEFVDPAHHAHPPRRSQVPLLLGMVCFVAVVAVLLSTQRANRVPPTPPGDSPPPVVRAQAPPPRGGWLPAGFVALFNGSDLAGWHPANKGRADAWSVSGGVIVGTPKRTDQILLSDREYGDFELVLEYRWPRHGGHTSILLRAGEDEVEVAQASLGIPLNIGDDEGFSAKHGQPIGRLNETGTIREVTFDPPAANKPIGEWNALRVVARGNVVEIELNGVRMPTADLAIDKELVENKPWYARPKGAIGLVCHWGTIEFRHVAVKTLP